MLVPFTNAAAERNRYMHRLGNLCHVTIKLRGIGNLQVCQMIMVIRCLIVKSNDTHNLVFFKPCK